MKKTSQSFLYLSCFLLTPVVAMAGALIPVSPVASRSAEAGELHPGVVVDASGGAIYLMNPDGGIDAVSASSGEVLWSSGSAARPLALLGDRLVAQGPPASRAGALDVLLLDTRDGEPRQTLTMALPDGLRGAVDEGLSSAFEARGVVALGEPYVLWRHTRRYAKGVAPEPGDELELKAEGAGRLELAAGRVVSVDPATVALGPSLPAGAGQAAQQWNRTGELSAAPAPAGDVFAATLAVDDRLVLKRWSQSGAPLPDTELFAGPYLLANRSADGRHLVVVERVAPGEWEEYGWTVFSLESGRRLGEVRSHQSHAWYVVQGSSLIYVAYPYGRLAGDEWVVEKQKLRAIEVEGGALIWERPLRDTQYRGPFPP